MIDKKCGRILKKNLDWYKEEMIMNFEKQAVTLKKHNHRRIKGDFEKMKRGSRTFRFSGLFLAGTFWSRDASEPMFDVFDTFEIITSSSFKTS